MKKLFTTFLVLSLFTASLIAQSSAYYFSNFGGGLPSSAVKTSRDELEIEQVKKSKSNSDDADAGEETIWSEEDAKKEKAKRTTKIVLGVVGGAAAITIITVGTIVLVQQAANSTDQCCSNLGDSCGQSCSDSCSDSLSDSCSQSLSSSCSSGADSLFASLPKIPVYVP